MNIHQLSVRHDQVQDRLLVSLNTTAQEELKFWLTRRLMSRLWSRLNTLVIEQFAIPPDAQTDGFVDLSALDHTSKKQLMQEQQETSLNNADFQTPYKTGAKHQPFGDAPLLVTKIDMAMGAPQQLRLRICEDLSTGAEPREFQMELSADLTFGLMKLLGQALTQADWQLHPDTPRSRDDDTTREPFAHAPKTRYLN